MRKKKNRIFLMALLTILCASLLGVMNVVVQVEASPQMWWYDPVTGSVCWRADLAEEKFLVDFDGDHLTAALTSWGFEHEDYGTCTDLGVVAMVGGFWHYGWAFRMGELRVDGPTAHIHETWRGDITEWFYFWVPKTTPPTDWVVCLQRSDGVNPINVTSPFWFSEDQGGTWYEFDPSLPVYTLNITTTTGGTTDPSPGTHIYSEGTVVDVRATPYTYYEFDHWVLDGENRIENPISVTMDSDHTLHAVFVLVPYDVTIEAYCLTEGVNVSVSIILDGSPTGYTTPHTFTGLTGTHTFTVPSTDPHDCPFRGWSTDETGTTITVTTAGTYTAYYGIYINDVAVTDVAPSKTVVGQGYCMNISVTVENQGDFLEWFGVVAPYFGGEVIPTPTQWETFWSMGDVNRDGYIDQTDLDIIGDNWGWTGPPGQNPADINSDGSVDGADLLWCAYNTVPERSVIWTYFGLPLPPKGTQRGAKLYPGNQTTLTFTWNTTGVAKGNYTITAYAEPVPGETDTTDNTLTDGWIIISLVGDVTGREGVPDGIVEAMDLFGVAKLYGAEPPNPKYDPNYDINCDGIIEGRDLYATAKHYGEEDP